MVSDTKHVHFVAEDLNNQINGTFVGCVECGHDRSWHFSSNVKRIWTDEEWEIEENGTWDKGRCQWDNDGHNTCHCITFKHPDAPRRREAIEHTRSL